MRRTLASRLALPALIGAAAGLVSAWVPLGSAVAGEAPVVLMLPAKATIKTTKGQSYSGVRLSALSPSQITYERGGQRALAAGDVSSIAFLGKVSLIAKGSHVVRGVEPRGCTPSADEVQVAASALAIQGNGTSLALLPAQLPKQVRIDLRQSSQVRTLVVNELRVDPGGKVRVVFRSCAPES
ncbi:MAG: hypothetical protein ACKOPS_03240 [Cyanobium sp.]